MTKASNTELAIEEYGYKQVKKYKIPNDWQLVKLGDFAIKIGSGKTPKGGESVYQDRGIPFIRSQNVLNNKLELDGVSFISDVIHNEMKSTKVIANDVLLNITGASIGRCCVVPNSFEEGNVNQHVCIIRTKENLDRNFLVNILLSPIGQNQIFSNQAGGNREGLNFEQIRKLDIPLPPIKEQQKIALIMSTWDKAIELKEKLIAQKKEQKKGIMQKLLTGEVRIVGYRDDWKVVSLGGICSITTGKLDANAMAVNGKYKFFTCAEEVYSIDEYAFDTEALLISGNGANVGYIHYYKGKFNAYQRTYVLSGFSENILFIKYILDQYLKKRIYREKNAGNMPYITLSTLKDMNILIPSIEEQNAICDVLVKMDLEIMTLTDELKQIKVQKKGLMQQLLTGKIRVKA